MKYKKLKLKYEENNKNVDSILSNALLTQLMVQIIQIGARTDNSDQKQDSFNRN